MEPVPADGLADVLSLAASPDPAGPLLAGMKAGLFASRDRGATWTRVAGMPAAPVSAVAYHATDGVSSTRPWRSPVARSCGAATREDGGRPQA